MKLRITRYTTQIAPEDATFPNADERDTAFIEEVLGLKNSGDEILLRRVNVIGLSSIAYLETIKGDLTK